MTAGDRKTLKQLMARLAAAEAEPLLPLIDEYMLARDDAPRRYDGHHITMKPRPRPPGRLSPSAVYGCPRSAVMKFAGVGGRRKVDPDQQLLFEDGNWRHHKWQYLFYDMECVLGRSRFRVLSIEEFVAIPELYVAGSLDVLIAMKIDGRWRRYVIDIKGINDRGFSWVTSTDEAKADNIRQLLLYMKAKQVKRGILLYDNKNTNLPKTFTVDFNGQHWKEVLGWIEEVVDDLKHKRLPERHPDCKPGVIMHENCPFRSICWSNNVGSAKLRNITYDGWKSIDHAWEKGLVAYG